MNMSVDHVKYSEINLRQLNFLRHKSLMDFREIEPDPTSLIGL
jgi:hypothetical protein